MWWLTWIKRERQLTSDTQRLVLRVWRVSSGCRGRPKWSYFGRNLSELLRHDSVCWDWDPILHWPTLLSTQLTLLFPTSHCDVQFHANISISQISFSHLMTIKHWVLILLEKWVNGSLFKEINSFDRKFETAHFQMTRPIRSRLQVSHAVPAKFDFFFMYLGPFGRLGQNKRQLRWMPVLEIPDDHPPTNPLQVVSHF